MKCGTVIKIKHASMKQWKKRHNKDKYVCGACLNRLQDRSMSRSEEHRKRCSIRSKNYWKDPAYRQKMIRHLAKIRSLGPGPSNLERSVWRYLDDLDVNFISARDGESFTLGPWSFDIKIDKSETKLDKHLLLEIDGFYRHSRKDVIHYDRAKETFVEKYHKDHKLIRILEHEFLAPGRLKNRLDRIINNKYIKPEKVDICQLHVDTIDFSVATPFLGAYHYLGFVNKRGIPIGCFCGELIRLAIHPSYQKKNFASFIISKSVKTVKKERPEVKLLVSFADNS